MFESDIKDDLLNNIKNELEDNDNVQKIKEIIWVPIEYSERELSIGTIIVLVR